MSSAKTGTEFKNVQISKQNIYLSITWEQSSEKTRDFCWAINSRQVWITEKEGKYFQGVKQCEQNCGQERESRFQVRVRRPAILTDKDGGRAKGPTQEIVRTWCQALAPHIAPHSPNLPLTRDYSVQHLNELNKWVNNQNFLSLFYTQSL